MTIETNNTPELIADSVAHKDEVVSRLTATVDEFLEFSSPSHLLKLLSDVL